MEFTVGQIATLLGGEVVGDSEIKIKSLGKIQDAKSSEITFLSNLKYESFLYTTQAGVVIVPSNFIPKKEIKSALIKVADSYSAFSLLLEEYYKYVSDSKKGIEEPSFIGEQSSLGENCYRGAFSYIGKKSTIGTNVKIYPHVYIGDNVEIGDNSILYSGVKIYSDCKIGKNCKIHAGVVIGSDGFGFAPQLDGSFKSIPQIGNVIIEDNVDVGANTVIDCATMGSTIIKKGVKLDNLIQIAHNVIIGENTVIAAQTGIAGSVELGASCMIGGQVGIAGHIKLAPKTRVGAQSGVGRSIEKEGIALSGSPAFDYKTNMKSNAIFKKLPDLLKQVEKIETKLINLPTIQ